MSFIVVGTRGSTSKGNIAPFSTRDLFGINTSILANNGRSLHEDRICSCLRRGSYVLHPCGFNSACNGNCYLISYKDCDVTIVGLDKEVCLSGDSTSYPFTTTSRLYSGTGTSNTGVVIISFRTRTADRGHTLKFCLSNGISIFFNARARIRATSRRVLRGKANCVASLKVAKPVSSILNMGGGVVVGHLGSGSVSGFRLTGNGYALDNYVFRVSVGANGAIGVREVRVG